MLIDIVDSYAWSHDHEVRKEKALSIRCQIQPPNVVLEDLLAALGTGKRLSGYFETDQVTIGPMDHEPPQRLGDFSRISAHILSERLVALPQNARYLVITEIR